MADNPQQPEQPEQPEQPQEPSLEDYQAEEYEQVEESFEQQQGLGKGPAVAAAPGKTMIMAFGGGAIVIFLLYQLLFSDSEPPPPQQQTAREQAAPVAASEESVPSISQPLPPMPMLPSQEPEVAELPPPPPPPPISGVAQGLQEPEIDFSSQPPNSEQLQQRRSSEMMVINNAGGVEQNPQESASGRTSPAPMVQATKVGNLTHLILQGKVIKAVLETAIDSTLPGPLRALVTRDVYAEAGDAVLIPKGSRLIGSYNTDLVQGQARIFVVWNRVIRPDGIDLNMESPTMDNLGRAGLKGFVDNRFFEIFSGALLSSVFTIGTAYLGDAIAPGQVSTTQNTDGSQNVQGDPVSIATAEAAQNLAQTAQRVLGGIIDTRPVITVDQGTPVNVFVNQDLEFPPHLVSQVRMIQ